MLNKTISLNFEVHLRIQSYHYVISIVNYTLELKAFIYYWRKFVLDHKFTGIIQQNLLGANRACWRDAYRLNRLGGFSDF